MLEGGGDYACPAPRYRVRGRHFLGWTGRVVATTGAPVTSVFVSAYLPHGATVFLGSGADQLVTGRLAAQPFVEWFAAQSTSTQRRVLQFPLLRDVKLAESARRPSVAASAYSLLDGPGQLSSAEPEQPYGVERMSVLTLPRAWVPLPSRRGSEFDATITPARAASGATSTASFANGLVSGGVLTPLVLFLDAFGDVAALAPLGVGVAGGAAGLRVYDDYAKEARKVLGGPLLPATGANQGGTPGGGPSGGSSDKDKDKDKGWFSGWCTVV